MRVQDIMTKKAIFVFGDTPLAEITELLTKGRYHALPVVDEKKRVIGIIAETDLFIKDMPHLYLPSYIDFLKNIKTVKKTSKKYQQSTHQLLKASAKDIMTSKVVTVSENFDVKKLIKIFQEKKLYSIPVVNLKKQLIGIVTVADVIKLI